MSVKEQRSKSLSRKIRSLVSLMKSFKSKRWDECRKNVFVPDFQAFEILEKELGSPADKGEFDNWCHIERKKIRYIDERRLLAYIVLRIRYCKYFECEALMETFDYKLLNLFNDLGAILKKK